MKFLDKIKEFWNNQTRNYKVFLTRDILSTLFGNLVGRYSSIYMTTLGATTGEIGYLTSILSAVRLLLSIPGGILTDRAKNIKKLYLSGRLLQVPINLVKAFYPQYFIYSLTRVWDVVTFRVTMPTSNIISIASMSNKDRVKSLVMNRTIISVVGLVAPFLAAWMVTSFGGLEEKNSFMPLFLVQFVISIVIFIMMWKGLEEPQYVRRVVKEKNPLKDAVAIFREYPGLKRMLLLNVVRSLFINMRMPYIQLYFYNFKNADAYIIAAQGTISTAVTLLLSIPMGTIADRYGRKRLGYVSQILMAACVLAAVLTPPEYPQMILLYSLLSSIGSCMDIGWQAFVQEYIPLDARGRWSGLSTTATALIGIPAPIIGAWFWNYNPDLLWWISLVYYLLLAIPLRYSIPDKNEKQITSET